MADIKGLLREARLPEETVELCLRGDLVAEYEALEVEHDRAVENRGKTLDAGGEIVELKQWMDELQGRMAEGTVTFRLRALKRPVYRALSDAHPPRKDDRGDVDARDKILGVNVDTFFEPLVKASVIEPELDDEDWQLLLDERLTDRQFDRLAFAAVRLNRGDVDVPFSLVGSKPTPT